jgi:adenylate cyclase
LKPSQPQRRLIRNHILLSLLLTFVITAAAAAVYRYEGFRDADLAVYDAHFRWRGPGPVTGRTVLVLMDQESSERLGRKKDSWSRSHMARALENLCRAGAEVIGLDMVFFAPDGEPDTDRALASAMQGCSNVVLAWYVAVEGRGEVRPLPVFQEAMIGDGFVNMVPDRDGVLRKVPFLSIKPVEGGLAVYPSFSLEMVRAYRNLDFVLDFSRGDHFLLGGENEPRLRLPFPDLRINYAGREDAFACLSYADVVEDRFPAERVEGKIVLIGSALPTDKDFFATPFSGAPGVEARYGETFGEVLTGEFEQKTAGVACHAHAVETILMEKHIRRAGPGTVLILVLLSGLLGVVFYPQRPGAFWGLLILAAAGGLALFLAHRAFTADRVWVEIVPVLSVLGAQYVAGIGVQRAYSRKRGQIVAGLFGKYVSRGVVDDLLRGRIDASLEGRSVEVTVLFSDLRGFTTLSESLSPRETGLLLNSYFDVMIPTVFQNGGTLDKLIGDAVMAFFGAPADLPDHPSRAALTALAMVRALEALRARSDVVGVERLAMGIGLNTGAVTAGNLGSQSFMDYTVIGDTVNLASRLEGLTKHYRSTVIVSGETAARLDERFLLRELDRVRVKGKDRPVAVYELAGLAEETDPARKQALQSFESGLARYRERDWNGAEEAFRETLRLEAGDGPAALYLERVRRLRRTPPSPEWDGVTVFESK